MKTDNYKLLEFLLELNQMSFKYLLDIYDKKTATGGKLIFPVKRRGELRISEQELRFAYAATLERKGIFQPYFYSVEPPTAEKYHFKGVVTERSGSSDLSLYEPNDGKKQENKFNRVCNIECKAHNADPKSIQKDIQKLVREEVVGGWGHLLLNQDSGTLRELLRKITKSFQVTLADKTYSLKYADKPYFFSFGILGSRQLISRKIEKGEIKGNISKIFSIDYEKLKGLHTGKYCDFNGTPWQVDVFK